MRICFELFQIKRLLRFIMLANILKIKRKKFWSVPVFIKIIRESRAHVKRRSKFSFYSVV